MPRNDALWTDYDGDEPYVDYLVNASDGQPVNQRRYLPGLGHFDDVTGTTAYVHGDQVGTLRRLTDGVTGATLLRRVHTAFGQQALSEGPTSTRYGYAGAFGYESFGFADLPFIHVGERWYDPSTGRFLQRDPIGIDDGPNPYAYARLHPTILMDPSGRGIFEWLYTGDWNASSDTYNACVTEAAKFLTSGSLPTRYRAIAGAGGVLGGIAGSRSPLVGKGLDACIVAYSAWRFFGDGSTGYSVVDDALDAWSIGYSVGRLDVFARRAAKPKKHPVDVLREF